jgi:hypothetical protein
MIKTLKFDHLIWIYWQTHFIPKSRGRQVIVTFSSPGGLLPSTTKRCFWVQSRAAEKSRLCNILEQQAGYKIRPKFRRRRLKIIFIPLPVTHLPPAPAERCRGARAAPGNCVTGGILQISSRKGPGCKKHRKVFEKTSKCFSKTSKCFRENFEMLFWQDGGEESSCVEGSKAADTMVLGGCCF